VQNVLKLEINLIALRR